MEYKIWIIWKTQGLAPGLYKVIDDDRLYDRGPLLCKLENGKEMNLLDPKLAAVHPDLKQEFAFRFYQPQSNEQMNIDLDALRPYYLSVEEYVRSYSGDLKKAWQAAIIQECSYRIQTEKQKSQNFISALNTSLRNFH